MVEARLEGRGLEVAREVSAKVEGKTEVETEDKTEAHQKASIVWNHGAADMRVFEFLSDNNMY